MEERIFITGGTGFIGSHLARRFVKEGAEVCLFDINPSTKQIQDIIDKVKVVKGDVSILSEVLGAAKEFEPTKLMHLAAVLSDVGNAFPMTAYRINFDGVINALEVSRLLDLDQMLFASSEAIFAKGAPEPINDDSPKYPQDPYGISKLFGENWGMFYVEKYGLDIRGFRGTWVYGPGRLRGGTAFSSLMIQNSYFGKEVSVPDLVGNFSYIEDLLDAINVITKSKEAKSRFYLVTGEDRSTTEVAQLVRNRIPNSKIKMLPVDPGSAVAKWPSRKLGTAITNEFGWKPKYPIEKGIDHFINTLKSFESLYN
ncbi:MAG: NAD(P)-dependent oxidoreductase [Candidatus Micrarchaeaceae archaeon]